MNGYFLRKNNLILILKYKYEKKWKHFIIYFQKMQSFKLKFSVLIINVRML